MKGHNWGGIRHDNTVTWLAYYKDYSTSDRGNHKYFFLDASSRFKGESDMKKYNKARKLQKLINKIRENYMQKI